MPNLQISSGANNFAQTTNVIGFVAQLTECAAPYISILTWRPLLTYLLRYAHVTFTPNNQYMHFVAEARQEIDLVGKVGMQQLSRDKSYYINCLGQNNVKYRWTSLISKKT